MTILTYGAMVYQCLKAAQTLEEEDDLEVEVIDLRSLTPLDRETILESVKRTNKVLIVHEDTLTGGIGAELAAILAEDLFEYLDGPITRVAAPDVPFPVCTAVGGSISTQCRKNTRGGPQARRLLKHNRRLTWLAIS